MKNRWKFDGKSSKIELGGVLGPLGVPYWYPWASWKHLGSVLRASWSVLGASRWHPGARRGPHMDPRMGPKSSKNRSKIALVCWTIFRCDFDRKMVTEWLPNPSKSGPKKCFIFRSFFSIDFWIDLGGRNPWKWAPRVHETLIFIKSPFPILTYFSKQKWWKKASNVEPKWLKKSINFFSSILDLFWRAFGTILGVKIRSKIE